MAAYTGLLVTSVTFAKVIVYALMFTYDELRFCFYNSKYKRFVSCPIKLGSLLVNISTKSCVVRITKYKYVDSYTHY